MPRSHRLTVIAQLLSGRRFASHDALAQALGRAGHDVTQATLSRDLRSLGVAKRSGPDGESWYELPTPAAETLDHQRQQLDLRVFVNEVRVAQNLAVVITPPGHAMAVGRAIDLLAFDGLVGSVAGDDTILCVLPDTATAKRFKRLLDGIAGRTRSAK